ncbi:WD repeat-containing protein 75 isoform X2 [Pseudophryne corroboree]|uniref:WD repeat-containing protein 75 isoform X2 n=1 Tax=Pseudophryne corroboree TaxID=495146 RepID=UPI003081514F
MVYKDQIRVIQFGGSRITYRRPVFSADAKYLLCVSGDVIKVYSTSTEECFHVLHGHKGLVTGMGLNPKNPLQLYSCSLDGTVKLWDFMDGVLIKNFLIGLKMFGFYTTPREDSVYVITSNNETSETFQLVSVNLPKSTEQESEAKEVALIFDDISQSPKCTAVGRDGEYIATVKGLCLLVYYLRNKKYFRFSLSATSKKGANNIFTVVTCHPGEDCIATGHKDGKIRLWRKFNCRKEYTYSTLHWHHDTVADLIFSVEGTILFSGGVESVLVQWSYSMEHQQEYLPRLGAAIEHISTSSDGSLHCTSHIDNQITIIDAGLKVSRIIQGLLKGNKVKTGLLFDSRSKSLVLNGKPGHLQFYSLHDDKQLYNLDIVQQEFVNQFGLQYMDLVKAAFSSTGFWLATVEELQGKKKDTVEVLMKLWEFSEELQSFVLNTTVNSPHEDQITSINFQNSCDPEKDVLTLVSTGNDGLFKVWVVRDISDIYRKCRGWSCDFVGSYHRYKATDSCFSEDGSLLAVSFEEIIAIWESSTWHLKHTFCQPPGKIRSICFGKMSSSKYFLASTDNGYICCWDLITCALVWKAQLDADILQPDSLSENIAAFAFVSGKSNLFIFDPADPVPLYVHPDVCQSNVECAVFVPRDVPEMLLSKSHQWLTRSQLYFLLDTQDLMTFSTKSPEERLKPFIKQLELEDISPFTPFCTLLGNKRQQKQDKEPQKTTLDSGKMQDSSEVKELLYTPAHVLPPSSILCTLFVNALLISKQCKCTDKVSKDVEMKSEKEDEDPVEYVHEPTESNDPMSTGFSHTAPFKLNLSQEKKLRRIRKTDFSWVSDL